MYKTNTSLFDFNHCLTNPVITKCDFVEKYFNDQGFITDPPRPHFHQQNGAYSLISFINSVIDFSFDIVFCMKSRAVSAMAKNKFFM